MCEAQKRLEFTTTLELDQELTSRGRLGGVAVDQLGFIYVSNFSESVWQISPEGTVKLLYDGLYGGSGNTIDGEGNLLQSNFFANNVVKISRNGKAEGLISSGLNGPVGIEVDTDRNILVCNFAGNYVSITSPDGVTKVLAKSELFNGPNGITLHPDGGRCGEDPCALFPVQSELAMRRFAVEPEVTFHPAHKILHHNQRMRHSYERG